MPKSLSAYLYELKNEGAYASQGSFTLNSSSASEKMEHLQIPTELVWMTALTQCAVAAKAEAIDIKMGTEEISWEFRSELLSQNFNKEVLQQAFEDKQLSTDRWLKHLIRALWSAGKQENRGFQIRYKNESLVWNGTKIFSIAEKSSLEKVRISITNATLPIRRIFYIVRWLTSKIARIFYRIVIKCFAYSSPVPITFNGVQINGYERFPLISLIPPRQTTPAMKAIDVGTGDIPGALPLTIPRSDFLLNHSLPPVVNMLWIRMKCNKSSKQSNSTQNTASNTASKANERNALLFWVCDGVTFEAEPLPSLPLPSDETVAIFLCADDFPTDLTGASLVQTDKVLELKKLALQSVRDVLIQHSDPR